MMPGHLARSDAPTMAMERALRMVLMGLNKSLLAFGAPHRSSHQGRRPVRRRPRTQASGPVYSQIYSQSTDLAVAPEP